MRSLTLRMTLKSSKYSGQTKTLLRKAGGRNGLGGKLATATVPKIRVVIGYVSSSGMLPSSLIFFGVETHFTYLQNYTPLRRRETTVTSDGLHEALRFWPNENTDGDKKAPTNRTATRQHGSRRSLIFSESAHSVEIIRRRRSTGMAKSGMSVVG